MAILKILAVGVLLFVLLSAVISNAQMSQNETLLPATSQTASVVNAVQDFVGTGALTFYKHSGMTSAWLMYENQDSEVFTKALVFTVNSTCAAVGQAGTCVNNQASLADMYGSSQVRVIGIVEEEHVVVEHIALASMPDERVALVQAGLGHSASALGVTIIPRATGGETDTVLARAEVAHDGITEEIIFEQGTLVGVGKRKVTLTHASAGVLFFAIAMDE